MISNARGKHSSPGVYIEEIEKSYSNKSLGVTTLGLVGETLKGPAFEPIRINDWAEFQDYFGGTSTKKFKGNGYPQYEATYIAKSYLSQSKQLEMCRVLGLSGYNAGVGYAIYGSSDDKGDKYIIAMLRSKGAYSSLGASDDKCSKKVNDDVVFSVSNVTMKAATSSAATLSGCTVNNGTTTQLDLKVGNGKYGRFTLEISATKNGKSVTELVTVSLNPGDKDYIVNVLGMSPQEGDYSLFVEEMYDLAHIKECDSSTPKYNILGIGAISDYNLSEYKEPYRCAMTPWFVSEIKGGGTCIEVKKLFRFYTISDGNAANSQIKISIEKILPDEGLFDVVIRDFHDVDESPVILERFSKCNMVPGTENYIGLKIGTFNGDYSNKSKYVTVEVNETDASETCIPCGFLGYPMRNITGYKSIPLAYNTDTYENIKPNRQYFGMSTIVGVDLDVLNYKGTGAYNSDYLTGYSEGFHLDSFINNSSATSITVDGVSGFKFVTPVGTAGLEFGATALPSISTEESMKKNVYSDIRFRKFTCYPYGGFDGWDIYRENRTNTNEFRVNKYNGAINSEKTIRPLDGTIYGIQGKAITSDYYAYLAGYKQFDNPHKIKINVLATPGIDYVNNLDLFNEVLDIVEESRQGDCIYIVTTPDTIKKDGVVVDIDAEDAAENIAYQEINTSYAATYYPWVKYYDKTNKKYINLPVTKDVVRNFAYTDNVSHPWFASAGMSRGDVECEKACRYTKNDEEDMLYENMINPVKTFSSDGVKIWGNKTMYKEDTPLNRINVRRLMIRIKDLVMTAAQQLIFEQNDNTVDAQFRSIVNPILANAKQNRGISDYKIVTDTSVEARDRKELPAKIWVKPIGCLEYIPISFVVTPEGASFDE